MNYHKNKVSDIKIAYIGGGSRGWAWSFMSDLALEDAMSGTIALYDINHEAAKNNELIGNRVSANPQALGIWKYEVATTLQEALTDADFIVISILPGDFDAMSSDVHLPERLGIYQSVGDTAGPGGMIRALRTIPIFVEFAKAIRKYAPNAWVINYTNPMSLCMKALYETFPEIKAFGCCHEVFGTQNLLKTITEQALGLEAIKRSDIKINVLGINHFTWLDYASYKGVDLIPIYEAFIEANFEKGIDTESSHVPNASFASLNRVKFDLFKKYGLIAAAGDRHLAEFVSADSYLKNPNTVEKWNFGLTKVDWRKLEQQEKQARSKRLSNGEEEFKLTKSEEEGVLLIKALCGLGQLVSNVNVPNYASQISNLPKKAIVETNAIVERDLIRPISAGALPENILALTLPHIKNHEKILKAAIDCEKDLVLQAFRNDPLTKGKLTEEELQALVDDMISNTIKYLPANWQAQI